jgi:uncharacterized protein YndB with AHSA1/START domain
MTKGKRRIEMYFEIRSRPRVVFNALTSSEALVRWFCKTAEIDPRKGGRYRFAWSDRHRNAGEVLEFKPDQSLILTWSQNGEATRAAFRLDPTKGGTILRFRQTGLPRDLARPVNFIEVYARWVYHLTNLRAFLETGRDLRHAGDRY